MYGKSGEEEDWLR